MPNSAPLMASSAVRIPFKTIGKVVILCSHLISFHSSVESNNLSTYSLIPEPFSAVLTSVALCPTKFANLN